VYFISPLQESFAQKCFTLIDEYAPGFSTSVIGYDMLTPPDLEREIGLTGNKAILLVRIDVLLESTSTSSLLKFYQFLWQEGIYSTVLWVWIHFSSCDL
jgi:hypothetical protein